MPGYSARAARVGVATRWVDRAGGADPEEQDLAGNHIDIDGERHTHTGSGRGADNRDERVGVAGDCTVGNNPCRGRVKQNQVIGEFRSGKQERDRDGAGRERRQNGGAPYRADIRRVRLRATDCCHRHGACGDHGARQKASYVYSFAGVQQCPPGRRVRSGFYRLRPEPVGRFLLSNPISAFIPRTIL